MASVVLRTRIGHVVTAGEPAGEAVHAVAGAPRRPRWRAATCSPHPGARWSTTGRNSLTRSATDCSAGSRRRSRGPGRGDRHRRGTAPVHAAPTSARDGCLRSHAVTLRSGGDRRYPACWDTFDEAGAAGLAPGGEDGARARSRGTPVPAPRNSVAACGTASVDGSETSAPGRDAPGGIVPRMPVAELCPGGADPETGSERGRTSRPSPPAPMRRALALVEERCRTELTRAATVLDGVDRALKRLTTAPTGSARRAARPCSMPISARPPRRMCAQRLTPA